MSVVCTAIYCRQRISQSSFLYAIKKLIELFHCDRVGKGFTGGAGQAGSSLAFDRDRVYRSMLPAEMCFTEDEL